MTKSITTLSELMTAVNTQKGKRKKAQGFAVKESEIPTGVIAVCDSVATEEEEPVVEAEPETPTPAPVPDLSAVREMINSAIAPLQQQVQSAQQQADAERQARESLQQELDGVRSQLSQAEQERDRAKKDAEEAGKNAQILEDLGKLAGRSVQMPNVNTQTKINGEPRGLAKEFIELLNNREALKINVVGSHLPGVGMIHAKQRDGKKLNQWLQAHFKEEKLNGRDWQSCELIRQLDAYFKAHGLLSGRATDAAGPTTGASGAVPDGFLDVLSAVMRETHSQSNIFWQFTTTEFDSTSAPGKNILVPRFNYLPRPTTLADFVIANTTTFNPIGWTTGSGSDSQGLEMTTVPINCIQYGLGRGTGVGTRPVFIPEFHEALSLVNLMSALDSRLMQNYYLFEELMIRLQYESATTVVYNDNGITTSTPGDLTTGDDGTFTKQFANALYSQMYAAQIPTFSDGNYALVLNPTAASQFKTSLGTLYSPVTEQQLQAATNTFRYASGIEIGQVSGYVGDYENFHVFVGNSFGVGNAASSPTVVSATFGSGIGAQTVRYSFAFGPGAVGRGVALPMEIRSLGAPFQLGTAYIWVSREGVGAMDVDSTLTPTGQQTRVWKVGTLDRSF
jgi:hypothetical protein